MPEKLYGEMQMTCCDSSGNPGGDPPDQDTDKEMACGAGGGPDDIINPEGAVGTPKPEEIFTEGDPGRGNDIAKMSLDDVIIGILDNKVAPASPKKNNIFINEYLPSRPNPNPPILPKIILNDKKLLNDFLRPDPIALRTELAMPPMPAMPAMPDELMAALKDTSEEDAAFEKLIAKLREGKLAYKLPPELLAALGTGKTRPDIIAAADAKNPIEADMEERLKDDLIRQSGRKK